MEYLSLFRRLAPLGVLVLAATLRAADVPLVDFQNAEDVVGQTDGGGGADFANTGPFDTALLSGMRAPNGVAIDTTTHRLFVSDASSHRILIYDLDSADVLIDRNADHVLGQTDFYGADYSTARNRFYSPYDIVFDPGSSRLFVPDYNNHRVLIFDVTSIIDGQNAVNVLGQPDFTSRVAATTINGMNGPVGVDFDPATNRLFVSQYLNHRVTVYDLASVTDGENAVNVLGQADFTSGSSATAINRLKSPWSACFDSGQNRLFVAEYGNNRVTVFDVNAITNGENAVNVLGQTLFTTTSTATTQGGMYGPIGLSYDTGTQRLFVTEYQNHRLLIFDAATIANGENAVNVLGQADFTAKAFATSQSGLYYPYGTAMDSGAQRLYVSDSSNNRVLAFDVSTATIVNGANAVNVVGQTDGMGGPSYTTSNVFDGSTAAGFFWEYDVALDTATHRLFVADTYGNRVLIYNLDESNTLVDRTVDHVLGQPSMAVTGQSINQAATRSPYALAFDASTQRLFVANSNRVSVFDVSAITDGENAIHVLGQADFTSSGAAVTPSGMSSPYGLCVEPTASRLYVADPGNHRVLIFDIADLSDGDPAVNVLGQTSFTAGTSGTAINRMYNPYRMVHDGSNRLFVVDKTNQRVLIFDTTSISDGENAVNVLGQIDYTANVSGLTQNKLNAPFGIAVDRSGNRLFVGDGNNNRVLVFDITTITNGENAVNIIGQPDFTTNTRSGTQNGLKYPMGLAYDTGMNRLFISDQENNRVPIYSVGPVPPSTSTVMATTGVSPGEINLSWGSSGDDGRFNTLNGIYRIQYSSSPTTAWSTSATPAGATTVTLIASGVSPGVVQSTTVVVSPTPMQPWYFVIWTQDDASNWSAISSVVSAWPPVTDPDLALGVFTPMPVGNGLLQGGGAWGDFDNDGDLDILISGTDGVNNQLRVFKNNANGTFDGAAVDVGNVNGGLKEGDAAWGDFDNDGDLDVLLSGSDGANNQFRVYTNNGNGTFSPTPLEAAGTNNGLKQGSVAWGDYDNDGDLDILVSGTDGANNQLRVYTNNGNGTFNPTPLDVAGTNNGLKQGGVAWGDYDNDGDLDVLVSGTDGANNQLRVYTNNGNGTFNATALNVAGSNNGLMDGRAMWADFNKDGHLDVLVSGTDGTNGRVRVYTNLGNGSFDSIPVNVAVAAGADPFSVLSVGDFNTDGNPDIAAFSGTLRIYRGQGNAVFSSTPVDVASATAIAALAGGDADADGDLDLLAIGTDGGLPWVRAYLSTQSVAVPNTPPVAPTPVTGGFVFDPSGVSVASFTWTAGADSGTGSSTADVLTYDVRLSTESNFASLVSPGQEGASPRFGSYLRPPKIFNGNTAYGVMLKSTDPWNTQTTAIYGLRTDTFYYYQVKTIDAGLAESPWSNGGTLFTGVAPCTTTLTAGAWNAAGSITLSWVTPGNDSVYRNLTGQFRIQYGPSASAAWSTTDTPAGAYTITMDVVGVAPGTPQSTTISVDPTRPNYFVIWSKDDAGNWSPISSAAVFPPSTPAFGYGPFDVDSGGVGLTQGGVAWGDADNDGDLDVLASGTDGANNQLRVYMNSGLGTFGAAINVAGVNGGLKDGDVAWGDFDNDGDLDVLVSGTDGANNQLRVYKNNGNGTFDSTAIDAAGLNNGLKQGGAAWGDHDNDGDLDVLVNGTDGANNQLRVYENNGNGTFNATALNVAGVNGGLSRGTAAWGDFDKDGDLDILVGGTDGANRQLRVYTNNADGTFNASPINVAGANNGLVDGRTVWGDFTEDGYLDVLVSGSDGTNNQLRVFKNNGDGTFNGTPVDVSGSNGGVTNSAVAVGDFDADGHSDVVAAGRPSGLLTYWKLDENAGTSAGDISGNGYTLTLTDGPTWAVGKFGKAVNLDGLNDRIQSGTSNPFEYRGGDYSYSLWFYSVVTDTTTSYLVSKPWNGSGRYNYYLYFGSDRKLVAFIGAESGLSCTSPSAFSINQWNHAAVTLSSATKAMRLYLNGVEVSTKNYSSITTWVPTTAGDANLSLLLGSLYPYSSGWAGNTTYSFQGMIDDVHFYNRTLSASEVAGLSQATKSSISTLRVHTGVGDGSFNASGIEVDGGLEQGSVSAGDADGDGDLDILTLGTNTVTNQLQVYMSTQTLTTSNAPPSAPSVLTGAFAFNPGGVSVASFTWVAGADSGSGATAENGLNYDLRISTKSDFSVLVVPTQRGASPKMGHYLRPPKIFNGNTGYGVLMKSTDPWNPQTTVGYGLRTDTTYYYQVKTIDAGLAESVWSNTGTLWAGAPPSTSTLAAGAVGIDTGQIDLTWVSAGDDGTIGTLNGKYRIQYATTPETAWSTVDTPPEAYTLTIDTAGVSPGAVQSTSVVVGLGIPWYFVIWSQDDTANWSAVSSTVSASPQMRPPAPGGAGFTARTMDTLTAGWNLSPAASTYTFTLSTAADNPPVLVAGSSDTTDLSGALGSLAPNTTYYGFTKACNSLGCSAYSVLGATVTLANAPVELSTSALTSISVQFAWGANGNPVGTVFDIEQSTAIGGPYSVAVSTTGTSDGVSTLVPGGNACFRVVARSWDGAFSPSSALCLVPPFTAPGGGSFTTSSAGSVQGTWGAAPGVTSYLLRASTSPDNPPVAVAGSSVTATLTAIVAALTPNTTYYGFVEGCNGNGCSTDTGLGTAVTNANPATVLSTTTLTSLTATLTWNANNNPVGTTYRVERSTVSGGPYSLEISTDVLTLGVNGLTPGETACFRVIAQSHAGVDASASNEFCLVPGFTTPGAGSLTTQGVGSIRGDWGFASGATSYVMRLSTSSDNLPTVVAGSSTVAGLTSTVGGLIANTTYYGFVEGCNGNGCSTDTALGTAVTNANPATVLSTTTLTSLTATMAWNANSNPAGTTYRVERSTVSGGPYSLEISTTVLTLGVTGLTPGETACFRVIAQSHAGVDASASNEFCFVPGFTTPGPGNLTTQGVGSIRADWGSASGATSYVMRLSTSSDNPPTLVSGSSTVAGLTSTVGGLIANTTYFGFVEGCNGNGCSADTALGTAVTLAVVPQGLSHTGLSAVSVTVAFSANGNPAGTIYEIERAVDGGMYSQVLTTTTTTVSFTGLNVGATYSMRVRAANHGGVTSGYSNEISFTTTAVGPAVPMNLRGSLGSGGITYTWNPVTRDAGGTVLTATVTYKIFQSNALRGPFTEVTSTSGTVYGLVLSPPPNKYHQIQAECLDLMSGLTPVIDNAGNGRYVYPSSVGDLAVSPQGLLTGESSAPHTVSVAARSADGGLMGFEVTVVNPSGGSVGDVTFSPVGEMTVALPGATDGVRPVEKWMGSHWSLVGSARVGPPEVATLNIPRTGIYRVNGAAAGGPLVREVYNRSFSPNGDGRGDRVVFRVDNPENLPLEGSVYSSENMHVADMAAGPIAGLTLQWDGRAGTGAVCEGGIYHYEIRVGSRHTSGIVVLLK